MVARTWQEGPESVRVQVRWSSDITGGFDETATFADIDGACAQVRRCFEQFITASPRGTNS
jgi:hypothetical protein